MTNREAWNTSGHFGVGHGLHRSEEETRATASDARDANMADKLNCFHISLVHKFQLRISLWAIVTSFGFNAAQKS